MNDVMVDTKLPLMEAFCTIQGEGYHQGKSAFFIRLGGCDVGCFWCDVQESWDVSKFPRIHVDDITTKALNYSPRIAVVTGGEPLMHNLDFLCQSLQKRGFHTHIETSGAYPLSGTWDWICFSPKKFKAPLDEISNQADELKVVIYNNSDFKWAESYAEKVSSACKLFLQPEWGKSKTLLPLIVDYVKVHPQWEISLQIHKYMGLP